MPLKQLIVRRGRASVVYSDNVKTFVAASKWTGKSTKMKNARVSH